MCPKVATFCGREEVVPIYLDLFAVPEFQKHCPGKLQTTPHALEMYEYVQKRKDQYQHLLNVRNEKLFASLNTKINNGESIEE